MTRSSLHTIKNLVLGFSFVAAATISGCGRQSDPADTPSASTSTARPSETVNGKPPASASTPKQSSESSRTLFGIQFLPLDLLVPGGLGLIGIAALLLARQASKRVDDAFYNQDQFSLKTDAMLKRLETAERHLKDLGNKSNQLNDELRREVKNLLTRIDHVAGQAQTQRSGIPTGTTVDSPTPPATPEASISSPSVADLASRWTQSSPDSVTPAVDPVQLPAFTGPSKSALIAALNSADRQLLKVAARAELNITSDSESAIATGRSLATELEEVPAAGSYLLIELDREYWLFPTERTLRGFSASQPAKGLFRYEPQTIPSPQLIEPALLESSGATWIVKSMGVIAIP
jgi:hypothetical protein